MDSKKTTSASRPAARTPQPPPPLNTTAVASSATKPRSRSSTPTAPTVSALAGSRSSNGSSRQPKAKSNNNSGSPRVEGSSSGSKPTSDEPATEDDDSSDRLGDSSHNEWMRQSEETLAALEKQVQDATKRNLKHQTRCAVMRDSIAGKKERMGALQGSYASLNRELVELEALSSGDYDSDTLEEMFMSIPANERVVHITNAE